jgi:hypothetical protein
MLSHTVTWHDVIGPYMTETIIHYQEHASTENKSCFKKQLQNTTHIFYPQLVFSGKQGIRTAGRSEKSRALYFINTITLHGLFRKVCLIFSDTSSYSFCRTVPAKFDMGFSSSTFSRCFFLVLLLLIYCSSGTEVVTVDVHAAKDLIKSGYKYLDVRYVKRVLFASYLIHFFFKLLNFMEVIKKLGFKRKWF